VSTQKIIGWKYLSFIAMLFVTVSLCDIIVIYHVVKIGSFVLSGGSFVMPFYYFLTDLITEVYGYQENRRITWMMFFCCLIFVFFSATIYKFPSFHMPLLVNDVNQDLVKHLLRAVIGGTLITVLLTTFVNSYILSKLKIMLRGRNFFMRSLCASGFSQALEIFIECLALYIGYMSLKSILNMMLPIFLFHILMGIIILIPGRILMSMLKKAEGRDVYDVNVSFNPFSLTVTK
jgi:uncharacterized integral membrane protein (TIGR00697 family)